jgi:hypothetical protein
LSDTLGIVSIPIVLRSIAERYTELSFRAHGRDRLAQPSGYLPRLPGKCKPCTGCTCLFNPRGAPTNNCNSGQCSLLALLAISSTPTIHRLIK